MTVVFVTHSTAEAVFLAQRAIVLSKRPGRVVADHAIGLPAERLRQRGRRRNSPARRARVVRGAGTGRGVSVRRRRSIFLRILPPAVVLVAACARGSVHLDRQRTPLPAPAAQCGARHTSRRLGPCLAGACGATTQAALIGFAASTVLGVISAIALSSSALARRAFYPYTVFFQTVPIIASPPC